MKSDRRWFHKRAECETEEGGNNEKSAAREERKNTAELWREGIFALKRNAEMRTLQQENK